MNVASTPKITRVKVNKPLELKHSKKAKKTVGITISPKLLTEARKHKLNISRITEQALSSILEYLAQQNTTESSKFLVKVFP